MKEIIQSNDKELKNCEIALRDKFHKDAKVTDPEKGYLSLPWVNELIDPELQRFAAKLIASQLRDQLRANNQQLTKVAGVPTLGSYLSVHLAEELRVPLVPARKSKHVPERWKEAIVINENMKRTRDGVVMSHIYNGIRSNNGEVVLFVDDILGDGDTLIPIIESAKKEGIVPYVGVYADKLYRRGHARMLGQGITPVFCYGIERDFSNGNIILTPPIFKQ